MARKFIYSNPIVNKLPGSNQNYYLRTVTSYDVDGNGKPIDGTSETYVYYAVIANARWQSGTEDSYNFNQNAWLLAAKTKDKGATYEYYNYSQEDKDARKIPSGQDIGNPILGATAQQSLSSPGGIFYNGVQNALINTAVNTQPGLAQVVSTKQQNVVQQQIATAERTAAEENSSFSIEDISNINFQIDAVKARKISKDLRYPEKYQRGMDYIQFKIYEYKSQQFNKETYTVTSRDLEESKGTIYLPVQPTIMDTNTVSWGDDQFNILQMIGSGVALDGMNGTSLDSILNKFAETIGSNKEGQAIDSNIATAIKTYLTKMAVSSNNNLLSRLTGAVTNPNLLLLFNSPDLRNFNFTFKLTPRTASEGTVVRKIIRAFKEYMAVQKTTGNLFLEAPCIFKIRYIRGVDRFNKNEDLDHPGLNRIKTCALRNFSVNYTPAGSYMTYNDGAGTMTSYDLTMSFTELEPVYSSDYYDNEKDTFTIPEDHIGY